jgi:hypothetical protein
VPYYIPPVIGPGTLGRFASAADLYKYIRAAMPYQSSSEHEDEVYWQLTAYLLRANGRWDGQGEINPPERCPHRRHS